LQDIRRYFDGNMLLKTAFTYTGRNELFVLRAIASHYKLTVFTLIFHYYYYYYRHHHYTHACMPECVVVSMSACICVFYLFFFLFKAVIL